MPLLCRFHPYLVVIKVFVGMRRQSIHISQGYRYNCTDTIDNGLMWPNMPVVVPTNGLQHERNKDISSPRAEGHIWFSVYPSCLAETWTPDSETDVILIHIMTMIDLNHLFIYMCK